MLIAFFGFLGYVQEKKNYPSLGQNIHHQVPRNWDSEETNHELNYALKAKMQHVGPTLNKQGESTP
jgi:hypothetical protein